MLKNLTASNQCAKYYIKSRPRKCIYISPILLCYRRCRRFRERVFLILVPRSSIQLLRSHVERHRGSEKLYEGQQDRTEQRHRR